MITSKSNENIKYAIKLLSSSKSRKENCEFIIEGLRLAREAVKNGIKINLTFYSEDFYKNFKKEADEILKFSKKSFLVGTNIIKSISDTKTPQGMVCICEFIDNSLHLDKNINKVLVLDNIQNPSNLGAIIRICDALGFDGVIISKNSCDIYNPKVIRGSMGSVFKTKILISDDLESNIFNLNNNGVSTLAMVVERGAEDIRSFRNLKNVALVIGNEGNGIRDEIIKICKYKAFIPIKENVNSLNASVAAGIAMWEISR